LWVVFRRETPNRDLMDFEETAGVLTSHLANRHGHCRTDAARDSFILGLSP
jgi:hypothetical protein